MTAGPYQDIERPQLSKAGSAPARAKTPDGLP